MWFLVILGSVHAMYFTLPGNSDQCFVLTVGKSNSFYGAYSSSGKNEDRVIVRVYDTNNNIQYQNAPKISEDRFELKSADGGRHTLCFKAADRYSKSISFTFGLSEKVEEEVVSSQAYTDFQSSIRKMMSAMDMINRNIRFYSRKETVNRDLIEQTCDRVLWSNIAKVLVLILVVIGEMFLLKTFVDGKSFK